MMIDDKTALTIYLIRHAEATNTIHPELISGRTYDAELTKKGIMDSVSLGEKLLKDKVFFNTVYSSPIKRAQDTANIVSTILSINTHDIIKTTSLEELDFGDWEGKLDKDIYTKEVLQSIKDQGDSFTPPNGESRLMVEQRVSSWFDNTILKNTQFSSSKHTVAIFTHSFIINLLLHYILKFDNKIVYRIDTDTSSITAINYSKLGWRVMCVNDTSHLV
jgi:broad specificity phosphatase PhoE